MIWPFTKKDKKYEKTDKDKPRPLIKRLREPDSADIIAEEALKKSAAACTMSGILDDEAMEQLKQAKKRTDTMRRKVKVNKDNISSVLEGDENETVQERALRELEEMEARERAGA